MTSQQKKIISLLKDNEEAIVTIKPPLGESDFSEKALNTIQIDVGLDQYVFTGETFAFYRRLKRGVKFLVNRKKEGFLHNLEIIRSELTVTDYNLKYFYEATGLTHEQLIHKGRKKGFVYYKQFYTVWYLIHTRCNLQEASIVFGIDHSTLSYRVKVTAELFNKFNPVVLKMLRDLETKINGLVEDKPALTQNKMREFLSKFYTEHDAEFFAEKCKSIFNY